MSKYVNTSGGGKAVRIIFTTILVIGILAVIGLIFYPEFKKLATVTIPENIEQIEQDINNSNKIETEEGDIIVNESENETIMSPEVEEEHKQDHTLTENVD